MGVGHGLQTPCGGYCRVEQNHGVGELAGNMDVWIGVVAEAASALGVAGRKCITSSSRNKNQFPVMICTMVA